MESLQLKAYASCTKVYDPGNHYQVCEIRLDIDGRLLVSHTSVSEDDCERDCAANTASGVDYYKTQKRVQMARLLLAIKKDRILDFKTLLESIKSRADLAGLIGEHEFKSLFNMAKDPAKPPDYVNALIGLYESQKPGCIYRYIAPNGILTLNGVVHVLDKEAAQVLHTQKKSALPYFVTKDPMTSLGFLKDQPNIDLAVFFNRLNQPNPTLASGLDPSMHTSVLIIKKDATGCKAINVDSTDNFYSLHLPTEALQKNLPGCKLYHMFAKRQADNISCPVYAIEDYLAHQKSDLFQYVDALETQKRLEKTPCDPEGNTGKRPAILDGAEILRMGREGLEKDMPDVDPELLDYMFKNASVALESLKNTTAVTILPPNLVALSQVVSNIEKYTTTNEAHLSPKELEDMREDLKKTTTLILKKDPSLAEATKSSGTVTQTEIYYNSDKDKRINNRIRNRWNQFVESLLDKCDGSVPHSGAPGA